MYSEHLSIGQSAKFLGVSISTLRRWDLSGVLKSCFRTNGNHRRYKLSDLLNIAKLKHHDDRKTIGYARVSTHSQKKDLETQKAFLNQYCNEKHIENYEIMSDLGSGLNFKKKGLNKLIELIISHQIKEIIVTHKDRMLRFGLEIILKLCQLFNVKFTIINHVDKNFEQAFCEDICEIMTVFSSKLYGKRSHKNKNALKIA